ncbi:MAG: urease accessory protein UreD [Methylococcales symbiont of Hymedesmia sp. n. MRB-2018]|nr:MAG: urease accessory protein UreD [Methylococcales symbiont of Hymedesmia sp. n. MRB-2018]
MDKKLNNFHLGWKAELTLGFAHNGNKTVLAQRSHKGPLTVQRPFYPEGGLCHVYIIHPPGGIVSGDQLSINVQLGHKTKALITTPGAAKFYRSNGEQAVQTVSLKIKEDSVLEWLPQETLIFEGARLLSDIRVDLLGNAKFIAWEICALGRPAAGESFKQGEALLKWQVFRDGMPLFLEKMCLDSEAFLARWGLNGYSSCGTFLISGASKANLESVRALIADTVGQGVTLIDDLLICRATADKTELIRCFFEKIRTLIRMDIVQEKPCTPRIWAT